jgi:carbon-monoxide dehydrogenase small subunit
MKVSVTVNGTAYERDIEPRMLLAYFLRESLGLTGTHVGCDTSSCGCCVVVLDGDRAVKSCTMFAVQADGHEIDDGRGARARRETSPAATSVLGSARTAVRLLHARHADDVHRAAQA